MSNIKYEVLGSGTQGKILYTLVRANVSGKDLMLITCDLENHSVKIYQHDEILMMAEVGDLLRAANVKDALRDESDEDDEDTITITNPALGSKASYKLIDPEMVKQILEGTPEYTPNERHTNQPRGKDDDQENPINDALIYTNHSACRVRQL